MHHYFLGTQLLASTAAQACNSHSQAYFCTTCGDIWARLITDDSPDHFDLRTVCCEHHIPAGVPGCSEVPGTLCQGTLSTISTMRWIAALESLPLVVLEREFRIEYQHFLRNHHA